MNRVILRQLSAWMGFVGTMTIISGVVSVLTSVFTFALAAIPGVITIILGLRLRAARSCVDEIIATNDGGDIIIPVNILADNLNSYFRIQGILIILILILLFFLIVVGALAGFAFFNVFR